MTRFINGMLLVLALSLFTTRAAALAAETAKRIDQKNELVTACTDMMQRAGIGEESRKAMREFMQSGTASQTMANMEMARRMCNGDIMRGMMQMMEMMGSMGRQREMMR